MQRKEAEQETYSRLIFYFWILVYQISYIELRPLGRQPYWTSHNDLEFYFALHFLYRKLCFYFIYIIHVVLITVLSRNLLRNILCGLIGKKNYAFLHTSNIILVVCLANVTTLTPYSQRIKQQNGLSKLICPAFERLAWHSHIQVVLHFSWDVTGLNRKFSEPSGT